MVGSVEGRSPAAATSKEIVPQALLVCVLYIHYCSSDV